MENQPAIQTDVQSTEQPVKKETKWSYSRVSEYKQCPFKYWLHYDQGHYVDTDSVATKFGTAIHQTEEDMANALKSGLPVDYIGLKNRYIMSNIDLKQRYIGDWYSEDKSDRTYEEKVFMYLEESIYWLENYLKEHPTYQIVGAEVPILFRFHGKLFRGSIDRLLMDTATGEYIIQDIKSWPRIDEHEDELTTPLQFVVYALAASEMYEVPIEKFKCQYDLPLAPGGRKLYDAGTKGYLTRGSNKLDKLFEGIDGRDFKPKPTALCHWCQFCPTNENQPAAAKNLCPYYSEWTPERKIFKVAREWQGMENHPQILEDYIGERGE